jgi:energy-coupling factor transport system permease protein
MRDSFSTYHPIVNFAYFFMVILCSMVFMHPVFLGISATAAFLYSIYLNRSRALKFNILYLIPTMIAVSLINPLFNHRGVTILGYLRDNPMTLESIVYGIATGVMFASVILWFSCYNAVMTSDKFIYLFGRIIPAMSLIFSMVLRFVPKLKVQIKNISDAQRCIGRDGGSGSWLERAKQGIKILSIMTTWALENAIETADSMRSRGYGLSGRTSFSLFRFDSRDRTVFGLMAVLSAIIWLSFFMGENNAQYFPSIRFHQPSDLGMLAYAAYFLFCFSPVILNIMEDVKWHYLQSKI